jgi:23S rRNA (cytosine1962-C5)-methyltransferase
LLGFGTEVDSGYRVIYGESDGIPGVVVDRYRDVFVVQISTAGGETVKPLIVEALVQLFSPASILERSDLSVRKEEKLTDAVGLLFGQDVCTVEFTQNGLHFLADVAKGQKTGFYLDQRELRRTIGRLAGGRQVLNIFSGSGSFAVAASEGGAVSIHNVDSSQPSLDLIGTNLKLNELSLDSSTSDCADVFNWISSRSEPTYDMVIADPPALIKSHSDAAVGRKAYHFLNRAALRLLRNGGIFITCSCSSFFNEEDFAYTLRRASIQVGVDLRTLEIVRQSADHPISVYFPESYYLKSFICRLHR